MTNPGIRFAILPLVLMFVLPLAAPFSIAQIDGAGTNESAQDDWSRTYLLTPPENRSDDRALYWFGEAIVEGLEEALLWAGADLALREERRTIEREYGMSPLSVPTLATRLKQAEELRAGRLVAGWFSTAGNEVTISFEITDGRRMRRGPAWTVGPLPLSDLAAVQRAAGNALLETEGLLPASKTLPDPPAGRGGRAAYVARVQSLMEDDPAKRIALLSRAVRADAEYLQARLELALLQRNAGDTDAASVTLGARSLRGDSGLAAAAERLAGEIHLDNDRLTKAVEAFRRSLRWNELAETHLILARALARRGDIEIAAAELELARRMDPGEPGIQEVSAAIDEARSRKSTGGS